MIAVHGASAPRLEDRLVCVALQRSVGLTQARCMSGAINQTSRIIALVNPGDGAPEGLLHWLDSAPRKLVVFGPLPDALAQRLGVEHGGASGLDAEDFTSSAATRGASGQSPASVRYAPKAHQLGGRAWQRPMCRYDFADEWNNLGYGAITSGDSIWASGHKYHLHPQDELAALHVEGQGAVGAYAGLFDGDTYAVLWFNRPVGPIDSFEWRLVENFLSSHRHDVLPVQPVICEVPFGHDVVVTARLDCDEDVGSARALFDMYQQRGIPLSLAILTGLLNDPAAVDFAKFVRAHGGSILSHSATHPQNWGGSYACALEEAKKSARQMQTLLDAKPRYAVSPFHQTPQYACEALVAAGYQGCVGGAISATPAFNMARGGQVADMQACFVGHTQQCMLHGDCLAAQGDPLAVYREAFVLAHETHSIFAYLDHPFSQRYQYGWESEEARAGAHGALIDFIKETARNPLFLNTEDTLDLLHQKAQIDVISTVDGFIIDPAPTNGDRLNMCLEFRGQNIELETRLRLA